MADVEVEDFLDFSSRDGGVSCSMGQVHRALENGMAAFEFQEEDQISHSCCLRFPALYGLLLTYCWIPLLGAMIPTEDLFVKAHVDASTKNSYNISNPYLKYTLVLCPLTNCRKNGIDSF